MKNLFIFLFILYPLLAHSQTPEYQRFMDAGKRELRAKNYDLAGKKFAAAGEFAFSQEEQKAARDARKDAERLRVQALENALREANRQKDLADNALQEATRQKDLAESEKNRAQEAEKKATAVLDKIYFYQDRYGLAYDKSEEKYGFIDKNLQTKIAYKYQEALPFDYTGYAKVNRDGPYFFVDTLGLEYLLATELIQLGSEITALDLRGKGLTELPDTVLKSPQLKVLLLSGNMLQNLSSEIGKLTNLQTLYLTNNQLTQLPSEVGKLTNLQSLDLFFNQLAQLPPEIGKLTNLQSLGLSSNSLEQLPAEIGKLSKLQSLDLSSNLLEQLPPEIGKLSTLQSLDLSENQIAQLPPEIGKLTNLQWLELTENPISTEYIEKLREEMPWCQIYWTAPEQEVEEIAEEPPSSEALFKQNEAERINQEQIAADSELQLKANPTDTIFQKKLVNTYNELAWRQLLTGQFSAAEATFECGFQLDSTNIYLLIIRAPSLLLQGKTEAAKLEYQKWKDLPFGQQGLPFYRDVFLSNLMEFEKAGIIPAEQAAAVEEVRKMLLEKKE